MQKLLKFRINYGFNQSYIFLQREIEHIII